MRHFCTYFDHRYLARGLALYDSLRHHCKSFTLWVLCLDDLAHTILTKLDYPGIVPIAHREFAEGDAGLAAARGNRSLVEYYFTCTPSLPLYVLRNNPQIAMITYLDADLFFFSDPEALFEEMGEQSIAITAHRFPPATRYWEDHGKFNVGWLSFRRDEAGLSCLKWWRERCLEWCYDTVEGDRFADQKYLDRWPELFPGVKVLDHCGANVASWNLAGCAVSLRNGRVLVNAEPLVFFHFHHLKRIRRWLYATDFDIHSVKLNCTLKRHVFSPYLKTLSSRTKCLATLMPAEGQPIRHISQVDATIAVRQPLRRRVRAMLQNAADVRRKLAKHGYLVVVAGGVV